MPDAHTLSVLTELRRAATITQAQMAQACGLVGRKGRESVSAWERGQSIPHARTRPKFIDYLGLVLNLQSDPARFHSVWSILVDQWHWEPVSEAEWHQHFVAVRHATPGDSTGAESTSRMLVEGQALLGRMPTTNTALPSYAPLPPGSRMPFSRNPLFVGRATDLRALATVFKASGLTAVHQVPIAAAAGLGGIGKTQLAVEFAHRYGHYFAGGVFWLSFADPHAVSAEIAACGGAGYMALQPDFESLPLDRQVERVWNAWASPLPRLLIFDNCEDPMLLDRWTPHASGCRVLITSQRSYWDAPFGVRTLLLGVLSRRESVALLRKHCPDLSATDIDLIAIAAELDDLPLALHLAGHYLACYRHEMSPATYVRHLRSPKLLDHPSLQGGGISPTGHQQHIACTFTMSYDRLDASIPADQLAQDLLARAAHFASGEPIPYDLLCATLAASTQASALQGALQRLVDLGLLTEMGQAARRCMRMHRLVAAFMRNVLPDQTAQAAVEMTLIQTMRRLNDAYDQPALLAIQMHLRGVTDAALARSDERAAALSFQLSRHLGEIERYSEAMHYSQRSLTIRETLEEAGQLSAAENLHSIGELLDWQGAYAEAYPYHARALAIRVSNLGTNDLHTATSMNHVGEILHALCDYSGALLYYEQAHAIRTRLLGPQHPLVAELLNNLGLLLNAMGQYRAARSYAERAVSIWETTDQPNASRHALALNNLGYVLRAQGDYAAARSVLERALALRRQVYGSQNTYLGVTLNHLGRLAHYLGHYDDAQDYLERALQVFVQTITLAHPITASTLSNLGMVFYDLGQYHKARSYVEQALAIHQKLCGENHRHTARGLNHLGMLLHAQGDLSSARSVLERALRIRMRVLGQMHPDSGNSLANLGMVLLDQGDMAAAAQHVEHALAFHRDLLGNDHPYTARSLDRMGWIFCAQGDDATARSYLEQAVAIYQRLFGAGHPYTIACYRHWAALQHGLHCFSEVDDTRLRHIDT